jgi:hypothetical protein
LKHETKAPTATTFQRGLAMQGSRGLSRHQRSIPVAPRLGRMKQATLKHFVERLRPVFGEGRYCGAVAIARQPRNRRMGSAGVRHKRRTAGRPENES